MDHADDPAYEVVPMTLEDMGDICLGDLERAGGRLSLERIADDLPGLAAEWIPHGVRAGYVVLDGDVVVATRNGLDWLNRDRTIEVSLPSPPRRSRWSRLRRRL